MPKYRNACPPVIEKDMYPDCPFGCAYCITRARPVPPAPTDEEIVREASERDLPVYLSPWTDAYPGSENREQRTRTLLQRLRRAGCAYYVITKSDLVLRDAGLFSDYPRSFIAVSLNTMDDELARRTEPRAPAAARRLELIKSLAALGTVTVVVKIDPILPGVTDGPALEKLLSRLIALKPAAVTAETLRLNAVIRDSLFQVLTAAERRALSVYYPAVDTEPVHAPLDYRVSVFKAIDRTLGASGIRAAFCRASLPAPVNGNDCRGGYK